jgi:hypothetical protein
MEVSIIRLMLATHEPLAYRDAEWWARADLGRHSEAVVCAVLLDYCTLYSTQYCIAATSHRCQEIASANTMSGTNRPITLSCGIIRPP